MIPAVGLAIFGLCVLLLFLILIPIAAAAFSDDIKKRYADEHNGEQTDSILPAAVAAWICFAVAAGLLCHFISLLFQCLKFYCLLCFCFPRCLQCFNGMSLASCTHCSRQWKTVNVQMPCMVPKGNLAKHMQQLIFFNLPHRKPFIAYCILMGVSKRHELVASN